jgi:hypothetical protein
LKKLIRGPGIYVLILLVILLTYTSMATQGVAEQKEVSYNPQFLELVKDKKIKALSVTDNVAVGLYSDTKIDENEFPDQYDFTTDIRGSTNSARMVTPSSSSAREQGEGLACHHSRRLGLLHMIRPPPAETAWWGGLLPMPFCC